ncbi:hypothetical protein C8J55DRAFT_452053 [Lentinula edodes]|uniref:Protein kinase domain-containing protein n=1 Tax=Lentinula lateritia TaxID=40482 RepID=A0A9W9DUM1_9AGAR|nr:hypothetical protein C8J55DRAFT_452053 [Lentinula edodes]
MQSTDCLPQDRMPQHNHAHRRSLPASLSTTPRHSSPLNPGAHNVNCSPNHKHSASFSGPASPYNSPLSFTSPGREARGDTTPPCVPGAHQSAPSLGSPFKPSPDKNCRGRGLSLSINTAGESELPTLSTVSTRSSLVRSPTQTPGLLSPSATLRPEAFPSDDVGTSRVRARSGSAPKPFTGVAKVTSPNGIPPALAPTSSRASFWRRDEEKLLSPSDSSHSRPWHSMFDTSASSKDRPRRHSVATGTPTKEGKEGKDNETTGTVPVEQMENWEITRKRVAQAASSILGTSALIAHEILLTSVDLVELAPVPGLQAAARTLLQIWACLQQVDSNRLQCLRLTEHCADILLSVRQEVYEAGDEVEDELRLPFDKLTESFNDVHALLVKQAGRPFLKRYLKRDEISKQLHQCDVGLQEALGMFSISIQIRILKQVQLAEARRQHDTQELLRSVANLSHLSQHGYPIQPDPPSYSMPTTPVALGAPDLQTPKVSQAYSQVPMEPFSLSSGISTSARPPFPYAASSLLSLSGTRSVSTTASASASSHSLIPGLHGLPASSSHSSWSQSQSQSVSVDQSNDQSIEAYSWNYNSNNSSEMTSTGKIPPSLSSVQVPPEPVSPKDTSTVIPSVSITPSSRPSTATSSSTTSTQIESSITTESYNAPSSAALQTRSGQIQKSSLPQPPIQLIPTKSSIEAAGAMLDAIQRRGNVSVGSSEVEVSSLETSSTSTSICTVTPGATSVESTSTTSAATSTATSTTASHTTTHPIPPALFPSASSLPPTQVLPTLLSLTRHQAALDAESDYADLRGVMRTALSKGSDVEILKVLGVGLRQARLGRGSVGQLEGLSRGRSGMGGEGGMESSGLDTGEMAEAIKTLQRAHEAILERERWEDLQAQQQEQEDVLNLAPTQLSHVSQITSQQSLEVKSREVQVQQQDNRLGLESRSSSSSSSSIKMLSGIKRRMSLQGSRSYSSTAASLGFQTSLNETIIDEEVEGDENVNRGKPEVGKLRSKRGKVGARLMRSKTSSSSSTSSTATTNDSAWSRSESGSGSGVSKSFVCGKKYAREKDTLDKEFIESGIDALRRMSRSTAVQSRTKTRSHEEVEDPARLLPSWTITRYEIDREEKIGVGFFSDVYKGTWRPPSVPSAPLYPYSAITGISNNGDTSPSLSFYSPYSSRVVAIKVLAETTPRSLFLRETAIWKKLSHPNVLELYGASSASGDPPWFFVSPYMRNGCLVEYLRRNSTSIPHTTNGGFGDAKVPWGLILPGNSAYGVYEAAGLGGGKSLSRYTESTAGGLGRQVVIQGCDLHTSTATLDSAGIGLGLGLGPNAANPPDVSSTSSPISPHLASKAHIRGPTRAKTSGSESLEDGVKSAGNADVKSSGSGVENVPKEWDLLRFMHEIAKGMEYLHGQGVLHGDLKASNVLVDDKIHCVISDFGQSEMRSEAYRISGTALPHGTLRWQAPEIFAGSSQLTVEMDVYAFAICCTEVLSLGRMPWPLYDDNQVQNHIMANQRPEVPPTCFTSPDLIDLIRLCWATNPLNRPLFSEVASELKALRKKSTLSARVTGAEMMDSRFRSPRFSEPVYQLQDSRSLPSPDMYPIQLLPRVQSASVNTPPRDIHAPVGVAYADGTSSYSSPFSNASSSEDDSFRTANEVLMSTYGGAVRGYSETAVTVSPSIASTIKAGVHASSLSTSPFVPPGTLPFSPATASSPSSSAPPPPIFPNSSPYPLMPASSSLHLPGDGLAELEFKYNDDTDNSDITSVTLAQSQILKTVKPVRPSSSATSSIFTSTLRESQSDDGCSYDENSRVPGEELVTGNKKVNGYDGYDLPPLANDLIAEAQNERRYRLLLVHEFHPSLTLPLWSPAPVALGAVGYLSKPKGEFITLFNAFHPQNSVINGVKSLPSVHGYGKVSTGNQRQDKRNAAQRSLDTITGLLTLKGRGGNISKHVSRRYSYPLRVGHKTAHLCTETTMYRYVENLDAPKKWFKANVDTVLEIFGPQHQIQKEDLFFVIGSLDTPEYALFVSHNHPDGQAHFNVFSSSKSPQPWGTFTTDTETPFELGGPSYREPVSGSPICSNKISPQGSYPWNTVLIARLRFKPDVLEPTSL